MDCGRLSTLKKFLFTLTHTETHFSYIVSTTCLFCPLTHINIVMLTLNRLSTLLCGCCVWDACNLENNRLEFSGLYWATFCNGKTYLKGLKLIPFHNAEEYLIVRQFYFISYVFVKFCRGLSLRNCASGQIVF